jgi:hypothetical protein
VSDTPGRRSATACQLALSGPTRLYSPCQATKACATTSTLVHSRPTTWHGATGQTSFKLMLAVGQQRRTGMSALPLSRLDIRMSYKRCQPGRS